MTQAELEEGHHHPTLDHIAEEEDAEIQGAHERAGVPDAPHVPIDDGIRPETANRPSNVIITDDGTTKPRTARTPSSLASNRARMPRPGHEFADHHGA